MVDQWLPVMEVEDEWEGTASRYGAFFWSDKSILELGSGNVQLCEYTKTMDLKR